MKKFRLYTLLAFLLMAGGVTMQGQETNRSSYGEFYSFTGWTYPNYAGGRKCLAHFTEHGKRLNCPMFMMKHLEL